MNTSDIIFCIFSGVLLLTYLAAFCWNAFHDAQPEIDAHTFMAETVPQLVAEERDKLS